VIGVTIPLRLELPHAFALLLFIIRMLTIIDDGGTSQPARTRK